MLLMYQKRVLSQNLQWRNQWECVRYYLCACEIWESNIDDYLRSRNRSIAYLVLYRKINYQLLQELFVTKKRFELVAWNIILLFSIAFLQLRMWDFFMFSVFTTHALKNHSWHHNFVKSYNHIGIKMYIWMTQTVQCTKELAMKNINF